jgi:hypothetical protein
MFSTDQAVCWTFLRGQGRKRAGYLQHLVRRSFGSATLDSQTGSITVSQTSREECEAQTKGYPECAWDACSHGLCLNAHHLTIYLKSVHSAAFKKFDSLPDAQAFIDGKSSTSGFYVVKDGVETGVFYDW